MRIRKLKKIIEAKRDSAFNDLWRYKKEYSQAIEQDKQEIALLYAKATGEVMAYDDLIDIIERGK